MNRAASSGALKVSQWPFGLRLGFNVAGLGRSRRSCRWWARCIRTAADGWHKESS
jgi:hypothetical protein